MIAAVSERSDPFGGLDGYIQSLRGPPNRVPGGRPQFAGAKTTPTAPVPVPPIKSSAATPGAKSNSVIPYARVTPLNAKHLAADPGHLSFVSSTGSMPTGRRDPVVPERRNLCCSLDALNKLLTPDGSPDDARRTLAYDPTLRPHAGLAARIGGAGERVAAPGLNPHPLDDWRQVPMLREWTLDGVSLGVDTEENFSQLVHVAIGGIARQVVNVFGEQPFAMEELFVGLVATLDAANNRYTFEYVPFGGRVLDAAASLTPQWPNHGAHPLLKRGPGLDFDGQPRDDATGIERMVGAWRLGRVTDGASVRFKSATRPEHNVSVAVAIEWYDWRVLVRKYPGCGVGSDHLNLELLEECGIVFNWPSENVLEAPEDPEAQITDADDRRRLGLDELDDCPPWGLLVVLGPDAEPNCLYPPIDPTDRNGPLRNVTRAMFKATMPRLIAFFNANQAGQTVSRKDELEQLAAQLQQFNRNINRTPADTARAGQQRDILSAIRAAFRTFLATSPDDEVVVQYLSSAGRRARASGQVLRDLLRGLPPACVVDALQILDVVETYNRALVTLNQIQGIFRRGRGGGAAPRGRGRGGTSATSATPPRPPGFLGNGGGSTVGLGN